MTKFKLLLPPYVRLHRNMFCMQIFNFFMEKRGNILALKYFREKHNVLTFLNQTVLFCFIEPKWKFALQLNPGWIQVLLNGFLDVFSLEAKRQTGSKEASNQTYPFPLSTSNKTHFTAFSLLCSFAIQKRVLKEVEVVTRVCSCFSVDGVWKKWRSFQPKWHDVSMKCTHNQCQTDDEKMPWNQIKGITADSEE